MYIFIYLAAACGILSGGLREDLVLWPGIEPWTPCVASIESQPLGSPENVLYYLPVISKDASLLPTRLRSHIFFTISLLHWVKSRISVWPLACFPMTASNVTRSLSGHASFYPHTWDAVWLPSRLRCQDVQPCIVSFPRGEQSCHKGQICPFSLFLLMPQVNHIITVPETSSTTPIPCQWGPPALISFPASFSLSRPSPCILWSHWLSSGVLVTSGNFPFSGPQAPPGQWCKHFPEFCSAQPAQPLPAACKPMPPHPPHVAEDL